MSENTVRRLAEKLNVDVNTLIEQLSKAGLAKSEGDQLSDQESKDFLSFLTKREGETDKKQKLKLKLKRSSEELVTDLAGRRHKVLVIRRKDRVIQKRGSLIESDEKLSEEQVSESMLEPSTPLGQQTSGTPGTSDLTTEPSVFAASAVLHASLEESGLQGESQPGAPSAAEAAKTTTRPSPSKQTEEEDLKAKKKPKKREGWSGGESEERNAAGFKKVAQKGPDLDLRRHWELSELTVDEDLPARGHIHRRRRHQSSKPLRTHAFELPKAPMVYEVSISARITPAELAQQMAVKAAKVIQALMQMGTLVTANQEIDQETAVLVVEEMGHTVKLVNENALEDALLAAHEEHEAVLLPRAPVVTIMGHVDHGKTSLLDYIRRTKVAAKEAGGITQHIGAYSVVTPRGKITFLDTPGHAAFSAMRARGANITDVVVLVVAADDGVMPQTLEAIQHAKAAEVPIIVALNKMDKPDIDLDRIKQELSNHGVIPENWGGENQFIPVSAKTGMGIDDLLEAILVQTEVMELKVPVAHRAKGVVLEARIEHGRGAVATLLIRSGTLKLGEIVLAGVEFGRVRAMYDARGEAVGEAGPSDPVEILGLSGAPRAGDEMMAVDSERKAREVALYRMSKSRALRFAEQIPVASGTAEEMFTHLGKQVGVETLNIIVKADVQGSTEALCASLQKLGTEEVKVRVVGSGIGAINESDITLAMASKALVIGFNVRADAGGRQLAVREHVKIFYHSVIYNVIDDLNNILSGMLKPEIREEILGLAEVREVFRSSKLGAIAGCMVIDGAIKRNSPLRVLRNSVVIYEGELESLRRFKEDAAEVRQGMECGIGVKHYNDVKVGDQIEVFLKKEFSRTLEVGGR
jgi:translation initiation factor IF-2